ncbi:MAG: hypothetical protein R2854_24755 [Caldilineaceae bacterium]
MRPWRRVPPMTWRATFPPRWPWPWPNARPWPNALGGGQARQRLARFAPHLSAMVELNRELADAIGYLEHPYDALLLQYEPDMTAARLTALFADLKAGILPLLDRIRQQDEPQADFSIAPIRPLQQRTAARPWDRAFGYDLMGRLGASAHPFEIFIRARTCASPPATENATCPVRSSASSTKRSVRSTGKGVDPPLARTALTTDFLGLYAVGRASYGTHESNRACGKIG